ncbi:2-hydroxyacid dehydrogenase [Nonlabens antarcticus]|uniref:2-hydroxyacid dehydrogenase n=1 Tax=Nonlabens antarcticus TaxID=392714 RepID=UPI001891C1AF|nr:glyoxylate/hydroxypyruvate reductase A [Nonlabens antarcticus]
MALLLIRSDKNYDSWLKALTDQNSGVQVYTPETVENPVEITMALTWKAPKGSFSNYPNLKVIGSMGAGVDHLFDDPSLPQNVTLTRVVDEKLSSDMQEFVLARCLNHIKDLEYYSHLQQQVDWSPKQYRRVADVSVGILGFGTLGQAVGKKLANVGFKVSGWSHTRKEVSGIKSYTTAELDSFLATSEILICLLPLTDQTRNILNLELFRKLPEKAYLINVARGGHLNEADLIAALEEGLLSGAALDVFNREPLPKDHKFWKRNDISITPHVASMSSAGSVAPQVVENYHRMEYGSELMNVVSREKKY